MTEIFSSTRFVRAMVIIGTLLAAVVLGAARFGFREVAIVVLVILGTLVLVIPRAVKLGFAFYILTFMIGWRQIPLSGDLKIHPSEIMAFGLMALVIARVAIEQHRLYWPVSRVWSVLILWTPIALYLAIDTGVPWDSALVWVKGFLLAVPTLLVVNECVKDLLSWRRAITLLAATVLYVSGLGITEYFFPSVVAPFIGFFGKTATLSTVSGFVREDFTFFGGAITSVFLSVAFFPILGEFLASKGQVKIFFGISALTSIFATYLSGNRGPWIGMALGIPILVLFNPKRTWMLIVLGVAVLAILPSEFFSNLAAIQSFGTVNNIDPSVDRRTQLFVAALNNIQTQPFFGHGWGASGLAHSDIFQLAGDIGVPMTLLFLFWYARVGWDLVQISSQANIPLEWRDRIVTALAMIVAALANLFGEAIIVLPHVISPLWFMIALATVLPRLAKLNLEYHSPTKNNEAAT